MYLKSFLINFLILINYDFRNDHTYLNTEKRKNYLFNSSINGIEKSDFIFLIGTNPRLKPLS